MSDDVGHSGSVISAQLRLRLGRGPAAGGRLSVPTSLEQLPEIPVVDVGVDFPRQTLELAMDRAHALIDGATQGVPRPVLAGMDRLSRRWLVRSRNEYIDEIDALARRLGRPGAHFLSVSYEWGCTVGVGPSPDGRSARLVRTLDWFTPGLGRHVMAARIGGRAGPYVSLLWPGFVGILQAMAPGRFSAALNQAPLRRLGGGVLALDWLVNKVGMWSRPHAPPIHVLRRVMEEARDYAEARDMLIRTPLATPATFTLAGMAPHETSVIERDETDAHVIDGPACATNHWQGLDHGAHPRGIDSAGRLRAMSMAGPVELDPRFPWLRQPVLNDLTRLAMVFDAAEGCIVAQGFEEDGPATRPLELSMRRGTGAMPHAAE
jgi:hypothetical protein